MRPDKTGYYARDPAAPRTRRRRRHRRPAVRPAAVQFFTPAECTDRRRRGARDCRGRPRGPPPVPFNGSPPPRAWADLTGFSKNGNSRIRPVEYIQFTVRVLVVSSVGVVFSLSCNRQSGFGICKTEFCIINGRAITETTRRRHRRFTVHSEYSNRQIKPYFTFNIFAT